MKTIQWHPLDQRLKGILRSVHTYNALINELKIQRDQSYKESDRVYWGFALAQAQTNKKALKGILDYNKAQALCVYRYTHKVKKDPFPPQYRDRWGSNSIALHGVKPTPRDLI